jgi:hypothetical protein
MDNQQLTPKSMSELISQVATVAVVKTTTVGLSRIDKNASTDADRNHNARSGTGKVSVSRLAGAEDRIKAIKAVQAQARECLFAMTTAWGDRRLLPNQNVQKFIGAWTPIKQEHDKLVEQLKQDAPALIAQAEVNKGSYDVEPPTVEELAGGFSLEFTLEQVPNATLYRASGLEKAVEDALKVRFEADIAAAYQQAQADAISRVRGPVSNLLERMVAYEKREEEKSRGIDVGREGYFRDSVIKNVNEISQVFSSFNLTGDPLINEIAEQLEALDGIEAEDLRKSKELRKDTARRAEEILSKLGDWM